MEKKERPPNSKTKSIDLADFSDIDEPSIVNDMGIELLIHTAIQMTFGGWEFVRCARHEDFPYVFQLHYKKRE